MEARSGMVTQHPDTPAETAANDRLAELVVHLSDCLPQAAVNAVNAAAERIEVETTDDRLMIVAKALVSVRRGLDLREGPAPQPRAAR